MKSILSYQLWTLHKPLDSYEQLVYAALENEIKCKHIGFFDFLAMVSSATMLVALLDAIFSFYGNNLQGNLQKKVLDLQG